MCNIYVYISTYYQPWKTKVNRKETIIKIDETFQSVVTSCDNLIIIVLGLISQIIEIIKYKCYGGIIIFEDHYSDFFK